VPTGSRIVIAAVIAALTHAAPAFAQSFNRTEGTGNELPSYYDGNGGLHVGVAPQNLYALGSLGPAIPGARASLAWGRQHRHLQ
jgi:hypothetical protein